MHDKQKVQKVSHSINNHTPHTCDLSYTTRCNGNIKLRSRPSDTMPETCPRNIDQHICLGTTWQWQCYSTTTSLEYVLHLIESHT